MPTTVELTRFHVAPEQVERLLAVRPAMLADFRADRTGFLGARLVRLAEDQWLDIVLWRTPGDLAQSRAKGANLPGISAFFSTIDHVLSSETGTTTEGETPS
ncbi:hypothetical protein Sru01_52100 [Sphaerisporangium rufum]|uniref:ABM domain-containing protein n=1 Tax=Sphaerisporangium rufum TaxID=1381558 RepID=A0A919R6U5_9ACTN|nr:hypothetical protein [Sphaerisporangium rufum]GII80228.1 hypothetical protein Sru01_52100 [Sphaerisporangium rufum]